MEVQYQATPENARRDGDHVDLRSDIARRLIIASEAAAPLAVQVVNPSADTATGNITSASGVTGKVVLTPTGAIGTVAVQITGTWVGTLQFEGSIDGTNFVAVEAQPMPNGAAVTSTTANGSWQINAAGFASIQVRCSAYTSGTAVVTMRGAAAASEVELVGPIPAGSNTIGAVNIATNDTMVGSLTEAAPASDTASSGLNGRLQRIAQRLTALIATCAAWVYPTAGTTSPYTVASISFAAAADNVVVAGTAAQTIRVYRIMLTLASGTLTFKDGVAGTALSGAMTTTGLVLEDTNGNPLFVTSASNAFVVNTSAAVQLSGTIWYSKS